MDNKAKSWLQNPRTTDSRPSRWWGRRLVGAVGLSIAIWITLAIARRMTQRYSGWPAPGAEAAFLYFALGVSGIPPAILLVELIASWSGVISVGKLFSIDFSKGIVEQAGVRKESFGLPDNVIAEQELLYDSDRKRIRAILKRATSHDVVGIDIKDGNAWWVTRLLALCAGAVQVGAPKAMVFIGRRENQDGRFLGWAAPAALLEAILNDNPEYESRYRIAKVVARQYAMFGLPHAQEWLPRAQQPQGQSPNAYTSQPVSLHPDVRNYSSRYDESEGVMLAAVLIDGLRGDPALASTLSKNLENPPDRLTSGRLTQLFDHCLYLDVIDRSWANEKQVSAFLDTNSQFVALVRRGKYESMLEADLGQRAILRGLFDQTQELKGR